ncbi:MAG: hypothetical protein WDZ80_07005 [Candidatus Paceibacterota bacterium]
MEVNILEMKFLKSFLKTLKEFIRRFSGSKTLNNTDTLARYLTSSSQFSEEKKRVKPTALMPLKNKRSGEFETSLFNIESLSSKEVINLARKNIIINLPAGRSIYGTGDTDANSIHALGLIAAISEPPKKHLNIIGWPDEKSKRKQIAMELAGKCKLSLFEQPIQKIA